jgi:hypothetical protein
MPDVFVGLPKSVRIGPYDIAVTVKEIPKDDDGNSPFGLYTPASSIELNTTAPNAIHAADTMLHEVLHGVYGNAGLGPMSQEEQVVSAIATGLTQVLRDNPKLVAWLTKALRAKK